MTLDAVTEPSTEFVISDAVIASVAARAALETVGVVRLEPGLRGLVTAWTRAARQRWKGLDPAPADGVRVRTEDGLVTVQVDLVTSAIDQAAAVGQAVQRSVKRVVAEETGLVVAEVSVSILDIEPEIR
ncbi:Asp23/Gls24 family envelope stress response protein [Amycolatopsis sp. H20-H5]|uniref:Asp23/Gls24 family envelope stress response protein n=1 Tax=Amycolatopsis sp. H20-H5 TaxID=3046309 RepID=UPI002DBD1CCB|nr:Asp23/Gls24 family envelope stress response protein [Amycolatopsis sp. H20-H5]MEC3975639.1 Asp23/Gls24 family envelope stress response protein [Amycolatopsis sp. H20-H5]